MHVISSLIEVTANDNSDPHVIRYQHSYAAATLHACAGNAYSLLLVFC